MKYEVVSTGWWFGTWVLWLSIQLGMSSSQLTNSLHHFSEGEKPPTRHEISFFVYTSILINISYDDANISPFLGETHLDHRMIPTWHHPFLATAIPESEPGPTGLWSSGCGATGAVLDDVATDAGDGGDSLTHSIIASSLTAWMNDMGMDQYLLIPFLVGWTSINPSYFDVNKRGTRFWHTAICNWIDKNQPTDQWWYWNILELSYHMNMICIIHNNNQ